MIDTKVKTDKVIAGDVGLGPKRSINLKLPLPMIEQLNARAQTEYRSASNMAAVLLLWALQNCPLGEKRDALPKPAQRAHSKG